MKPTSSLRSAWERTTTRRFLLWLFCWQTIRHGLLLLGCLATLVAGFYAVENWRGKRAWDRCQRAVEARGESMTIAAQIPPPVPDEQNLALAPVLKPIFELARGFREIPPDETNALTRLEAVLLDYPIAGRWNKTKSGNLEQGTLTELDSFADYYRGHAHYPQTAAETNAAAVVLTALSRFQDEFQELQTAAAQRPRCRFPIDYTAENPFGIPLPHLSIVRNLVSVLNLRAVAQMELGQPQAALADLQLAFRLSDGISHEPLLIDHLVRVSTLRFILQTVREGLSRHRWDSDQLAAIESHLASLDLLSEHQLAMRGERAFTTGGVDYARRSGWREAVTMFVGPAREPPFDFSLCFAPNGWYRQNMVVIAGFMEDYVLGSVDVATRRVFPDVCAKANPALEKLGQSPYTFIARILLSWLGKTIVKSALAQTYLDAARVACALERYRLVHGRLPTSLDALVPQFITAVPLDVFDGRPLRYRIHPGGEAIIYSIGWNQTDDGGKRAWQVGKQPGLDREKGDWVWGPPD